MTEDLTENIQVPKEVILEALAIRKIKIIKISKTQII